MMIPLMTRDLRGPTLAQQIGDGDADGSVDESGADSCGDGRSLRGGGCEERKKKVSVLRQLGSQHDDPEDLVLTCPVPNQGHQGTRVLSVQHLACQILLYTAPSARSLM